MGSATIFDPDSDAPVPHDPELVRAMARRGILVFSVLLVVTSLVIPCMLLGIGVAVTHLFNVPICGAVGEIEVVNGKCGSAIAWEFWFGLSMIALLIPLTSVNVKAVWKLTRAREARLRRALEEDAEEARGFA